MNTRNHEIVKNLDYALRSSKLRSIVVVSEREKEGKSIFIRDCVPLLCELYDKKVLILDCQKERKDLLEEGLWSRSVNFQSVNCTHTKGLDYIHIENLMFLDTLPRPEHMSSLSAYYNEISQQYDVIFINTKTFKESHNGVLPLIPIDGAIVIKSKKSLGCNSRPITAMLNELEIPIIGIIFNKGVK